MAIYSQGANSTVGTTGVAAFDLKASATCAPKLLEFAVNLQAGGASTYGIGRPGNDGSVTQTAPVLVQAENPADPAGQTGTTAAWGTAPTVPALFLRRIIFPNTIGVGAIWMFPRGITCQVNKGIVLWNSASNSTNTNIWLVVDE